MGIIQSTDKALWVHHNPLKMQAGEQDKWSEYIAICGV